jgi:peptidyl-prolyl cis-trans isomerase-like 4
MAVLLQTSLGDIVIDLYTSHCPKTCENFLKLCKAKHYNNALFYAVEKDYLVQIGNMQDDISIFG